MQAKVISIAIQKQQLSKSGNQLKIHPMEKSQEENQQQS